METVTYISHHGILGQKWGVRRYQRKDGTLTKAGQKRYADAKAFVNRVDGTAPPPKPKPKKISEMTDEELSARISRMANEKRAYELQSDIYKYTNPPKAPSKMDNFKKDLSKTLLDATRQAAPEILKAVVAASFGIEMPSKDKNKDKNNQKQNQKPNQEQSKEKQQAQEYRDKVELLNAEEGYKKAVEKHKEAEKTKRRERRDEVKSAAKALGSVLKADAAVARTGIVYGLYEGASILASLADTTLDYDTASSKAAEKVGASLTSKAVSEYWSTPVTRNLAGNVVYTPGQHSNVVDFSSYRKDT